MENVLVDTNWSLIYGTEDNVSDALVGKSIVYDELPLEQWDCLNDDWSDWIDNENPVGNEQIEGPQDVELGEINVSNEYSDSEWLNCFDVTITDDNEQEDQVEEYNIAFLTPPELEGVLTGEMSVNVVKPVMKGPTCWNCCLWGAFYTCQNCKKSFHFDCAFSKYELLFPIFDKPIYDALNARWGNVNMVKCLSCLLSEETRLDEVKPFSVDILNFKFWQIATEIAKVSETEHSQRMIADIVTMASKKNYKTVEGFLMDFKSIVYKAIITFGNSLQVDEANINLKDANTRIGIAIQYCWQCDTRRYDSNGKYKIQKEYSLHIRTPCQVPHAIIWIKDPAWPYWPCKVLGFDETTIRVQCFQEKANPRPILFSDKKVKFKTYSKKYPGKKPNNKRWSNAVLDCRVYLDALKDYLGEGGVIVAEEAEQFDGDVNGLIKKMYPFVGEKLYI